MTTPRTVIVTGGGTGIGAAITQAFLAAGANVVVCQRTADDVALAKANLGTADPTRLSVIALDLAATESAQALVAHAVATFGSIDVVVNNAAITGPGSGTSVLDLTNEAVGHTISVNLAAPMLLTRETARAMTEAGTAGVIINISSVAARAAQMHASVYSATKAGLEGFTRGAALELAPHGIRVVAIAPGDIVTANDDASAPLNDGSVAAESPYWARTTPLGRRGQASDIAAMAVFLASEDASFITGSVVGVDGGWLTY